VLLNGVQIYALFDRIKFLVAAKSEKNTVSTTLSGWRELKPAWVPRGLPIQFEKAVRSVERGCIVINDPRNAQIRNKESSYK
jgi:hypothetical protein